MSMLKASIKCSSRIAMNESMLFRGQEPQPHPGDRRFGRFPYGMGENPPVSFKLVKEARSRHGASAGVPKLPPRAVGSEQQNKFLFAFGGKPDPDVVGEASPPESPIVKKGLSRQLSLPDIPMATNSGPFTGNAALDHVLVKLNKPKLREALDCLVAEVSKGKGKNSSLALFRELDSNGDNLISREEMLLGMRKMGVSLRPVELEAIMRAFDLDNSGSINGEDFAEVLTAYQNNLPRASAQRSESFEPFLVGVPVQALFKLPNMSSGEGIITAKGITPGSFEVRFRGSEQPAVVKASQIRCRGV